MKFRIRLSLSLVLSLLTATFATNRYKTTNPLPLSKASAPQGLYTGPWYLGPDWLSESCNDKQLNRYESRCYNEYLAVVTLDALHKLKGEVWKDVETCTESDYHPLLDKDSRLEDPDYDAGSRKYCDNGTGINTWEEKSSWQNTLDREFDKCLTGVGCDPNLLENTILGPTVFYAKVFEHFFNDFGIFPDFLNGTDFLDPSSVTQKPIEAIPYFSDAEPKFPGWQRPANRPAPIPANLGSGKIFPVFVSYNNDKIQLNIHSTTAGGACVLVQQVVFLSEGLDSYKQSLGIPGCGQGTIEVAKGMGTWDAANGYFHTTTRGWDPSLSNWFRMTNSTVRNNFWAVEVWYKWPGNDTRNIDVVNLSPPSKSYVKPPAVKPGVKSHIPAVNLTFMN